MAQVVVRLIEPRSAGSASRSPPVLDPSTHLTVWDTRQDSAQRQVTSILEHADRCNNGLIFFAEAGYSEKSNQAAFERYCGAFGSGSSDSILVPSVIRSFTESGASTSLSIFGFSDYKQPIVDFLASFVARPDAGMDENVSPLTTAQIDRESDFAWLRDRVVSSGDFRRALESPSMSFGVVVQRLGAVEGVAVILLLHEGHSKRWWKILSMEEEAPQTNQLSPSQLLWSLVSSLTHRRVQPFLVYRLPQGLRQDEDVLEMFSDPNSRLREHTESASPRASSVRMEARTPQAPPSHRADTRDAGPASPGYASKQSPALMPTPATPPSATKSTAMSPRAIDGLSPVNAFLTEDVSAAASPPKKAASPSPFVTPPKPTVSSVLVEKEKCTRAHQQLQRDFDAIAGSLDKCVMQHREARNKLRSIRADLAAVRTTTENVRGGVMQYRARVLQLENDLHTLAHSTRELSEQIDRANNIEVDTAKELSALKEKHRHACANYEEDTNRIVSVAEASLRNKRDECRRLITEGENKARLMLEELEKQAAHNDAEIQRLQESIGPLLNEIARRNSILQKYTTRISELTEENAANKKQLAASQQLQKSCEGLRARLQQMRKEEKASQDEALEVKGKLVDAERAMKELEITELQAAQKELAQRGRIAIAQRLAMELESEAMRCAVFAMYSEELWELKYEERTARVAFAGSMGALRREEPCITCCELSASIKQLQSQQRDESESDITYREQLALLQHEADLAIAARNKELASLTLQARSCVRRLEDLRQQQALSTEELQKKIDVARATHTSLLIELINHVADECPFPRSPQPRRPDGVASMQPSDYLEVSEEVCSLYTQWVQSVEDCAAARQQNDAIQLTIDRLSHTLQDAGHRLSSDRKSHSVLEVNHNATSAKNAASEQALDAKLQSIQRKRTTLERQIEQVRQNDKVQLERLLNDAARQSAVIRDLQLKLSESRREANGIVADLESLEAPIAPCEQQLREVEEANADLAQQIVQLRSARRREIHDRVMDVTTSAQYPHKAWTATRKEAPKQPADIPLEGVDVTPTREERIAARAAAEALLKSKQML